MPNWEPPDRDRGDCGPGAPDYADSDPPKYGGMGGEPDIDHNAGKIGPGWGYDETDYPSSGNFDYRETSNHDYDYCSPSFGDDESPPTSSTPTEMTYDEWNAAGFYIEKGQKSKTRNADGVATFTRDQVIRRGENRQSRGQASSRSSHIPSALGEHLASENPLRARG